MAGGQTVGQVLIHAARHLQDIDRTHARQISREQGPEGNCSGKKTQENAHAPDHWFHHNKRYI
jgi:hypothetical protein